MHNYLAPSLNINVAVASLPYYFTTWTRKSLPSSPPRECKITFWERALSSDTFTMEGHHRTPGDINTQWVSHAVLSYLLFMQLSPSALLAAVCYVTRVLRIFLIVITASIQRNETSCEGYIKQMWTRKRSLVVWRQYSTDRIRIASNLNLLCNSPSGCAV